MHTQLFWWWSYTGTFELKTQIKLHPGVPCTGLNHRKPSGLMVSTEMAAWIIRLDKWDYGRVFFQIFACAKITGYPLMEKNFKTIQVPFFPVFKWCITKNVASKPKISLHFPNLLQPLGILVLPFRDYSSLHGKSCFQISYQNPWELSVKLTGEPIYFWYDQTGHRTYTCRSVI